MTSHYVHGTAPGRTASSHEAQRAAECRLASRGRARSRRTCHRFRGGPRAALASDGARDGRARSWASSSSDAQIAEALAQADGQRRARRSSTCARGRSRPHRWTMRSGRRSTWRTRASSSSTCPIRSRSFGPMVRAVRPGGRIILEDDDHEVLRLWPEPPGFAPLWQAYMRTYDRHGNDPIVGRRLVEWLHQARRAPRRNTWIFFGSCAGHADFPAFVTNLAGVVARRLRSDRRDGHAAGVVRSAARRADAVEPPGRCGHLVRDGLGRSCRR